MVFYACGILKIIQKRNTKKKQKEVEGNVKICLPVALSTLIVDQCTSCDHSVEMGPKIIQWFSYQLDHAIICRCSTGHQHEGHQLLGTDALLGFLTTKSSQNSE
jgi:hypothetical protein